MKINTRKSIKPKIFILSNGELAEPQYFQDFKGYLKARTVKVIQSKNLIKAPWQLIQKAVDYKSNLERKGDFSSTDGDQIWCVFDVDNYWQENKDSFQQAITLAEKHGIQLAWSNECFEIWFLCHFALLTSTLPRKDYHTKLAEHFKKKKLGIYKKNITKLFGILYPYQPDAIKNAKKLFEKGRLDKNPSTGVVALVESLNSL